MIPNNRTDSYLCQALNVTRRSLIIPYMDEKIKFSERLNIALDDAGIPKKGENRQSIVGKMFGVTQKGARKWLESESIPKTETCIEISKKLKVSFEWLMTGRGQKELQKLTGLHIHNDRLEIDIPLLTLCIQSAMDNIPDAPNRAKAIYVGLMYDAKEGEKEPVITEFDNSNVINLMMRRVS